MDATGTNAQCTENILVENVNASGLGLTVGAIHPTRGHNCIKNVTFRCYVCNVMGENKVDMIAILIDSEMQVYLRFYDTGYSRF